MIDYFLRNGMLTPNEALVVVNSQKKSGKSLEDTMIELGMLDEDKVIKYCHKILGK